MPGTAAAITAAETCVLEPGCGRAVRYVDTGEAEWRTVVFFGGLGTSARACLLTELAPQARERLRLRLVSVERNGLGETPFDPSRGYADAVEDVLVVLEELGIARFCVVAFSGGGPYAAALAARVPHRVISLHLAAAAAGPLIATCGSARSLYGDAARVARDPRAMWRFPPDSFVHRFPGFVEAAAQEGQHALGPDGRGTAALEHEWRLLASEPLPDLGSVVAPAYLYWGTRDEVTPPRHVDVWQALLPNVVALRRYEHEAHDVQYRHWDQIMLDIAGVES
jgi:non-heme chloroperoxidase